MSYIICKYGRGGGGGEVPDGKTVTPINDVEIWQKCAGLEPVYDTLVDVLNDTGYIRTLMSDDNAVDYLVRSKQFIKSEALVPTMTSNTSPSGECVVCTSAADAYMAFDNDISTKALLLYSNSSTANWLYYKFTSPVNICSFSIYDILNGYSQLTITLKIQGSNDNSTWIDLYTNSNYSGSSNFNNKIIINNDSEYLYYRIYYSGGIQKTTGNVYFTYLYGLQFYSEDGICQSSNAMAYIGASDYAANTLLSDSDWKSAIYYSDYTDLVMNISIPKMTSNTTPSGVASMEGSPVGAAYSAFDKNIQTSAVSSGVRRISYMFEKPMAAKVVKWIPYQADGSQTFNAHTITFSGSNDGSTWLTLGTRSVVVSEKDSLLTLSLDNNTEYKYYSAIPNAATAGSYTVMCELNFFDHYNGGVQSWLKAANINKNYTTLSQVLADTPTLAELISNHDAVDYLVTARAFVDEICSNQDAMYYIGQNNYCANTLLADETWFRAIVTSAYKTSVCNVYVPNMTSNTTPSGTCSANIDNVDAWKAFNGTLTDSADCWNADTPIGDRLEYEFPSTVKIFGATITNRNFTQVYAVKGFTIKGTNDGTYVDIKNGEVKSNTSSYTEVVPFGTSVSYKKFGMFITSTYNSTYGRVGLMQYYGREDI